MLERKDRGEDAQTGAKMRSSMHRAGGPEAMGQGGARIRLAESLLEWFLSSVGNWEPAKACDEDKGNPVCHQGAAPTA